MGRVGCVGSVQLKKESTKEPPKRADLIHGGFVSCLSAIPKEVDIKTKQAECALEKKHLIVCIGGTWNDWQLDMRKEDIPQE